MIKAKTRKILLLPGDGIGPEVVREVKKIIEWLNKNKSLDFSFEEELIGGASIDANKIPITDERLQGFAALFYRLIPLHQYQ